MEVSHGWPAAPTCRCSTHPRHLFTLMGSPVLSLSFLRGSPPSSPNGGRSLVLVGHPHGGDGVGGRKGGPLLVLGTEGGEDNIIEYGRRKKSSTVAYTNRLSGTIQLESCRRALLGWGCQLLSAVTAPSTARHLPPFHLPRLSSPPFLPVPRRDCSSFAHSVSSSRRAAEMASSRGGVVFGGTTQKCMGCEKTVYLVDQLTVDNRVYHRACFRCRHCRGTLKLSNYSSFEGALYCKPHFDQLFKMTGSLEKSFEGVPRASKAERSANNGGYSNSRASSIFVGTQEKCFICNKTVYPIEKVAVDGNSYHRTCFRCAHGGCVISPSNYVAHEGRIYCKHHFSQIFMQKGDFSQFDKNEPARESNKEPMPKDTKQESENMVVSKQEPEKVVAINGEEPTVVAINGKEPTVDPSPEPTEETTEISI
ncbi:hypothetical protein Taro_030188 [Colocasia esculenta]|uniref:LIM zinc-binding domain-containing protein n=1 Tax=Colocasia esculenta TaxID=4460 RepID=A0A843W2J6_COLES|nr:hypothetical protein [Colocasia esculenta]